MPHQPVRVPPQPRRKPKQQPPRDVYKRQIPQLVYDEKKVEDIDTTQEDHIYDECRYFLMEHMIARRENTKKPVPMDDPLDLYKDERKKAYKFIRI